MLKRYTAKGMAVDVELQRNAVVLAQFHVTEELKGKKSEGKNLFVDWACNIDIWVHSVCMR